MDLLDGTDSPQGIRTGAPAAVLRPDDVPAAEAATPKTQGRQTQDKNVGRLVERTTMRGAEAAIGPISSQNMDPLVRLIAGPGCHRTSPLGEDTSGRYVSRAVEPLPNQWQAPDGGADATSPKGSAPSGEQGKHNGRTVQAAGPHATGNALDG